MVKMYKGDREVNAATPQVKRFLLAGWTKTPPGDAPDPVDPQPVDTTEPDPEPVAATEASEPEEIATNGGDEGEAGEEPADDAPADDADPDQDELPLAADSEQPGA